eukprot:298602-Chlamydomonas_euryale.AAC.2
MGESAWGRQRWVGRARRQGWVSTEGEWGGRKNRGGSIAQPSPRASREELISTKKRQHVKACDTVYG